MGKQRRRNNNLINESDGLDNERESSPVIQPFQIIRSQKPIADSPIQSQSKKSTNKKKKRSKAVEPTASSTTAIQMSNPKAKGADMMASATALNKFMRSIIKSEDEGESLKQSQSSILDS